MRSSEHPDETYEIREFVCARCGNCCRGEGIVRVSREEAFAIAEFLRISLDEFYRAYTREPDDPAEREKGVRWLVDKEGEARECIFLSDNACVIHPVKPLKCRTFPLAWRTPDVCEYCVGMKS